jgi:Lon protease-like protein
LAEIVHTFDDGRMNIVVEGQERFTVIEWTDGSEPYPTGRVETREDDDNSPPDAADVTKALDLFRKLAEVAGADVDEPDPSGTLLSFAIAAHVDFGTTPKQELLELGSERDRLHRLAELLDAALDAMTREREIRERAATNGRVSLD